MSLRMRACVRAWGAHTQVCNQITTFNYQASFHLSNYQASCKFPFVERKLEIEARMQEFANAGSIEVSVGPTKVLVDYPRSEENLQISKLEN